MTANAGNPAALVEPDANIILGLGRHYYRATQHELDYFRLPSHNNLDRDATPLLSLSSNSVFLNKELDYADDLYEVQNEYNAVVHDKIDGTSDPRPLQLVANQDRTTNQQLPFLGDPEDAFLALIECHNGLKDIRDGMLPADAAIYRLAIRVIARLQDQGQSLLGPVDDGQWWIAPNCYIIKLGKKSDGRPITHDDLVPLGDANLSSPNRRRYDGWYHERDAEAFKKATFTFHFVHRRDSSIPHDVGHYSLIVYMKKSDTKTIWYFDSGGGNVHRAADAAVVQFNNWLFRSGLDTLPNNIRVHVQQKQPRQTDAESCGLHAVANAIAFIRFGQLGWNKITAWPDDKIMLGRLVTSMHQLMRTDYSHKVLPPESIPPSPSMETSSPDSGSTETPSPPSAQSSPAQLSLPTHLPTGPNDRIGIAPWLELLPDESTAEALAAIFADLKQPATEDSEFELNISLLSADALAKLYDIIIKAFPPVADVDEPASAALAPYKVAATSTSKPFPQATDPNATSFEEKRPLPATPKSPRTPSRPPRESTTSLATPRPPTPENTPTRRKASNAPAPTKPPMKMSPRRRSVKSRTQPKNPTKKTNTAPVAQNYQALLELTLPGGGGGPPPPGNLRSRRNSQSGRLYIRGARARSPTVECDVIGPITAADEAKEENNQQQQKATQASAGGSGSRKRAASSGSARRTKLKRAQREFRRSEGR